MKNRGADAPSEVERKFLLPRLPDGFDRSPAKKLRQGYLAVSEDGTEVRLRREGKRRFLTVKSGHGEKREETEVPLERRSFAALWPLTRGRRVRKVRYRVPYGGLVVEIDVYRRELEGLVTAEVEFPDEEAAEKFVPPPWLGREVTGDERFNNRNLASRRAP